MSQRVPSGKLSAFRPEAGAVTDFTMYNPPEWNNVDIKPFKNSFDFQLDALNCGGVPTRTTPTLTPTTLKNIEQMFIELQSDPQTHQNEAGFVPPLLQPSTSVNNVSVTPPQQPPSSSTAHVGVVNNTAVSSNNGGNSIFMSMVDTKSWQGGITTVTDVPPLAHVNSNNLSAIPPHVISVVNSSHVAVSGNNNVPLNDSNHTNTIGSTTTTHRRNIGGRRPNKENGISPEEEERRKLRRERNKLAAARCRKRRLDHTNELVEETEELEDKKQRLHEEIRQLQIQKEELEFLLEAHKPCCQLRYPDSPQDIKPYILDPPLTDDNTETIKAISNGIIVNKDDDDLNDGKLMIDEQRGGERPKIVVVSISNNLNKARPNSLPVTSTFMQTSTATANSITDVPITTPSAGLGLNFDSFLEGATGYTPITSSMSCFVVPSCAVQQRNCNNSNNNGDLISPDTVPSKLVSL